MKLKRILPRSLLGRSLMILIVPVVLVQIVTGYVFFDRHWDRMIQRLCDAVAGEVAMVVEEIETGADQNMSADITLRAIHHLGLNMHLKPGQSITHTTVDAKPGWETMVADIFVPVLHDRLKRPFALRFDFADKWVYLDVQMKGAVLHVSLPERRVFSSSGYIYLLWVFASATILLLTAILFMRNQVRPIRKLAIAAERLGRGQEVSFFKPEGAREVRRAGRAFMDMAARIRRQMEQRTLMLAGVSHDLRTPVTRLKLALSMMPESPDTQDMQADLDDMERMIGGYLDFVRGEGGEASESTNLNAFLTDIIQTCAKAGGDIHLHCPAQERVSLKPMAFRRCLGNIISNAQRYGSAVWVTVTRNDANDIVIAVEDDGPGLSPELYEDVFKPFYRGDAARSQTHGSVGLGLSISMDIIHSHGGQIWLESSEDHGGLAVYLTIPA